MLQSLLDGEGLDHHPIPVNELTRENLTVLEQSDNQQYRFVMPGPQLQEEEWQQCLDKLLNIDPPPDYIVASGSLPRGVPMDFYTRVARQARENNSRVIVDSSEEALRAAARGGVYLLKPNMRELGQLAGEEIESEEQQVTVAQELVESDQAQVVVVSLGAAGALLVTKTMTERLRAPIVPIQSKIGAGDSMVAGIVLSLARGKELLNAIRFGVAAGAAAVMTPGTELCRRGDTVELYKRIVEQSEE
jgi:6-phosphofructokinase 2